MRPSNYPDIWLRIIATPFIAVFIRHIINSNSLSALLTNADFYLNLCWSCITVVAVWETNRIIIKILDRRYSWVKQTAERTCIQLSLTASISALEFILISYIHHILQFGYSDNFLVEPLEKLNAPVAISFVLLLNCMYTVFYLAKYHRYTVSSLKAQLEETIRVAEKLKLDKLYNEHSELSPSYYQKHLIVNYENASVPILADDVAYIYELKGKRCVKLFNGKEFIAHSSLESLELILDPAIFFRLNQQLLANMNAIKQCKQDVNGKLRVELFPFYQESVFVSRRKASEFKEWLSKKI